MTETALSELAFERQFKQAQDATIQANLSEPRAVRAYYDTDTNLITIHLQSGAIFSFPPSIAQGLAGANPNDLAEIVLTPLGDGLHWEKLDADFSLSGLLAGRFGTKRWMGSKDKPQKD